MSTFQFNSGWEKQLQRAVQGQLDEMASNLQQALDELVATHQGRPLDEVKRALSTAWQNANPGASITDPELTQYAEYLQRGKRIEIRNIGIQE